MKGTIELSLVAAVMFMCSAVAMQAQQSRNPSAPHMHTSNNPVSATGCLQKSSTGNGYTLRGQDGSTWQLTSHAINLDTYGGKQVSVAGSEARSARAPNRRVSPSENPNAMNNSGGQQNTMEVSALSVLGGSCQQ